ncbi:MAG: metal-dependent transcriptional regulator [Clostridia bacterium]|nr:metal-dependent transcriptional regulator [Clostridia bacterium]
MSRKKSGGSGNVSGSLEDYLEAILVIGSSRGAVRSVDVAEHLGFSKPSVSVAVKRLAELGHIRLDSENKLHLTESGQSIAERIYERHRVLTGFLSAIGVEEDIAEEDACRIEHVISQRSFEKIKGVVNKEKDLEEN